MERPGNPKQFMNVELPFILHKNQRKVFESHALYKVIKAGKRFGKTKFAIFALTRAAGLKPGGIFCYIAPTYKQAKNIAWLEFKNLIPHRYIKRMLENELLIVLVNDAEIRLVGSENADSLRGIKMHGVVFDEVAYQKKYNWPNIIRGQLLGEQRQDGSYADPGFAIFISSPINPAETMGKDMEDWFPEFYNEALRKKMSGNKDWDAWHFSIYDNPTLSRDQIEEIRKDNTDDAWGVEYLANESAFAGHVYSEFNFDRHVMEYQPSSDSKYVRGIDWGIAHPTVCLFGYVDDKNKKLYIEDEFVKSDNTIEESCDVIKKKSGDHSVDWTICDPSLHKRNSVTKIPDIQEFNKNGVPCIAGDNNHRGYNIVKMALKRDVIVINPKCRILIKQMRELQWTDKTDDDCPDVLRYMSVRVYDLMFKWQSAIPKKEDPKPSIYNFNNPMWKKEPSYESIKDEVRAY